MLPSDTSALQILGYANQVAISLNLHRKVEDASTPAEEVERRKRIWWSLYNLDRLVAATLHRPVVFNDADIDVEVSCAPYTCQCAR